MDQNSTLFGGFVVILMLAFFAFVIFVVASVWKVYTKADQPGWASIVPIYNIVVLHRIVGRPGWWVLLYFIPLVNVFVVFADHIELAKVFGKGTGFGVGLTLLSFVCFPILAFGDARYQHPLAGAPLQTFGIQQDLESRLGR